ncbi:MAG: hypothetical protein IT532_15905 [Burkholderiales bacterium]|nr:hypothetical protein [Burkholderiales bacterium]
MKSMQLAAVTAIVIASAGCAANRVQGHTAEEVKGHCAERMASSSIDPIREKLLVPLTIGQSQPIEMLANRTFPATDEERKAILALAEAHTECNRFARERLGPPPSYRASSQDRVTAALSDLYAGDITYGEFARSMLFIGARDQTAREDIEQAIRSRERWAEIDAAN